MSTPFLDNVFEQVDFDRDLVFEFFTVFSLFEYSLKNAGFRFTGSSNEAKPSWKDFANTIHHQFNPQATPELAQAINYILQYPVMRQEIVNNALVFNQQQRPQNINDTEWLSILIRGVRNNLFHGGKFRYVRPRDPELISSSLLILESWAQLHPDVELALRNV